MDDGWVAGWIVESRKATEGCKLLNRKLKGRKSPVFLHSTGFVGFCVVSLHRCSLCGD